MMIFSLFLMYDNFKFIIVFNNQELFNKERNLFIKWILKKKQTDKTKTNAKPAICKGLAKSKTQKRHPKRKLKQDTYPKKEARCKS